RGMEPVAGGWGGSGHAGVGVFDPSGKWYLRNSASPGAPDLTPFAYGAGTFRPVVGAWSFLASPAPLPQGVPAALAGTDTAPAGAPSGGTPGALPGALLPLGGAALLAPSMPHQ